MAGLKVVPKEYTEEEKAEMEAAKGKKGAAAKEAPKGKKGQEEEIPKEELERLA